MTDTKREQLRDIWRPLFSLGYKGAEQVDAQHMAYLITAAVDETEALYSDTLTHEQPDLINLTHRAQVSAAIDATEQFMDFLTSLPLDADYLGEALKYKYDTIKDLEAVDRPPEIRQ